MTAADLRLGLNVVAKREFSGVPQGTLGTVVPASNSWPDCPSVAVQWDRRGKPILTDWFSLDELEYLEVVNG